MSDLIVNVAQLNPQTAKALEPFAQKIGIKINPASGWHVSCLYEGEYHITLINPFARKVDAERAKAALDRAGLNTAEAMIKAGRIRCWQVAYEALAW